MITDFFYMFFEKIWDLFSIKWPGFDFTFGQVFLAVLLGSAALGIVMKLIGVHVPSPGFLVSGATMKGGNNKNIKTSENRKGDKK